MWFILLQISSVVTCVKKTNMKSQTSQNPWQIEVLDMLSHVKKNQFSHKNPKTLDKLKSHKKKNYEDSII